MKTVQRIGLTLILAIMAGCSTTTPTPSQLYRGQSAEQIFAKAETSLTKRSYSDAIKAFEALDSLYPYSEQSQQAQLDIIYAYYKADDPVSAVAAADRYIHLYPRSEHVDYAYYLKGLADLAQGESWAMRYFPVDAGLRDLGTEHKAFTDFQQLVHLFPTSRYAADARQRMIYLRNLYAHYEVSVADYYMQRRAYVAAANRATYVLQHYQGAPAVEDALVILVKANRALGLQQAANQALQVLKLNYPQSPAFRS